MKVIIILLFFFNFSFGMPIFILLATTLQDKLDSCDGSLLYCINKFSKENSKKNKTLKKNHLETKYFQKNTHKNSSKYSNMDFKELKKLALYNDDRIAQNNLAIYYYNNEEYHNSWLYFRRSCRHGSEYACINYKLLQLKLEENNKSCFFCIF